MKSLFNSKIWLGALGVLMVGVASNYFVAAGEKPGFTDYCERLEQEIQGRKHGFLAGNITYYIGGYHASWKLHEDETLGLTHPFHHDLRSRGVGLLESEIEGTEHTGVGNDYNGWEFYKDTRVLYGTIIYKGKSYENPKPTSMKWRPDKMICEYHIDDVIVREEKFIGSNDAAASVIKSNKPVKLEFKGRSFYTRYSKSSTAKIDHDRRNNALVIAEGGTVRSRPDPNQPERIGPCVYEGMSTVLSSSENISKKLKLSTDDKNVQHYTFTVPCDEDGTTVVWAMHDDPKVAIQDAKDLLNNADKELVAKTTEMNRQLNEEVPYFRCSDKKFEDIYYYLWSIYMMYYIDVQEGWEMENHTQSAVNNFLGIHRYDAAFQIKVAAWLADKENYAYGNVLTWKHLTENNQFRENKNGHRMLSDNKGTQWHSGAYGDETTEHVLGAMQIYEHTGDLEFLKNCYEGHFKKLFFKRLGGYSMNQFDVADALAEMAKLTGNRKDVEQWETLVRRDEKHVEMMFEQRWGKHVENFFLAPSNKMLMTNGFWAFRSSYFPREYAELMINEWALDKEKGFYGAWFPTAMAKFSMEQFDTQDDNAFGYTPDTAYFTLDGFFRQGFPKIASELTVNHLENYNYHDEWDMPVAPEAYERDLDLFGDQYSNFNAGKILLYLEGFGGLKYSVPDDQLEVRPAMPESWDWMEFRLPIKGEWTKIRYDKNGVKVTGSPLKVKVHKN